MNILLKGGPLDGQFIKAPTDVNGNPVEFAHFFPPLQSPKFIGDGAKPNGDCVEFLNYKLHKLHEIWEGKALRRHEYHYQGR
ncbi:hypothetical protein ERD95_06035 [Enterobacteriaceae bacterium ML5]|nr:hypothetical protein ERD95_06035 [Enterobacteriaceae bacterium ML5]